MVVKEHHQKQLPEVFCKKIYSSKFIKFHRKTLASECLFNKVACLNACNFIKKRLWHRCFPVKFVKFSRTPILKNICERLLLHHGYSRLATFNRSFWKLHISNYVKLLCTSFSYFRLFAVSLVSSLFLVSLQLSSLYTYFFCGCGLWLWHTQSYSIKLKDGLSRELFTWTNGANWHAMLKAFFLAPVISPVLKL